LPKEGVEKALLQQISLMNYRAAQVMANSTERIGLFGDNIIVDLNLNNLKPDQKFKIGQVILVLSAFPHQGCAAFQRRFGKAARHFTDINDFRGKYCTVLQGGSISLDDLVELIE